jgi:hypothetical protein
MSNEHKSDFPTPQPAPKQGGVEVHSLLDTYLKGTAGEHDKYFREKLEERYKFGKSKYGQGLMTNDGRDGPRDLEEELLDATYYLVKCLYRKENIDNAKKMLQTINDIVECQEKIDAEQSKPDSDDEYICNIQ